MSNTRKPIDDGPIGDGREKWTDEALWSLLEDTRRGDFESPYPPPPLDDSNPFAPRRRDFSVLWLLGPFVASWALIIWLLWRVI